MPCPQAKSGILLWIPVAVMWMEACKKFARATVTKHHKLGELTEIYCLFLLEARSLKSRC